MLEGELEKGTKKSNCLVGTNVLGRALHLPWKKKRGFGKLTMAGLCGRQGFWGCLAGRAGTGGRDCLKHSMLLWGKGEGKQFFNAGDGCSV